MCPKDTDPLPPPTFPLFHHCHKILMDRQLDGQGPPLTQSGGIKIYISIADISNSNKNIFYFINETCKNKIVSLHNKCLLDYFVGFYVAPTLLRSYDNFPAFTGEERLKLHLRAIFQACLGTRVEPPSFHKLAEKPRQDTNPLHRGASDSKSMILTIQPQKPHYNTCNHLEC